MCCSDSSVVGGQISTFVPVFSERDDHEAKRGPNSLSGEMRQQRLFIRLHRRDSLPDPADPNTARTSGRDSRPNGLQGQWTVYDAWLKRI